MASVRFTPRLTSPGRHAKEWDATVSSPDGVDLERKKNLTAAEVSKLKMGVRGYFPKGTVRVIPGRA